MGYEALTDSSASTGNAVIGHQAMGNMQDGDNNVAVGKLAMFGGSGSDANNNVAIGAQALRLTTTGSNNVAIGLPQVKQALQDIAMWLSDLKH